MPGGQAFTGSQGTLIGEGGDNNFAVTGTAATGATTSPGTNGFIPLRSKRTGGGTATYALTGRAVTGATGTLLFIKGPVLAGSVLTALPGTLLYRGQATISWIANTEPDLAGYRILHGTTPGVYSEFATVGLVTSYVWGGLLPHVTHYWVVQAFDQVPNFSGNSAEVSKAY